MKFAAIYIRVSTDAQAEEGYSIEAQKEQLTAYCISKGIKNYKYYIDGGWSGSNIDRPEMRKLIEDSKSGKISHCIVYKLDRLSRSQKDTLYLIEDIFNPNGVDFVSLNESMDTSTPMGRLMLGILSAFAQLERENIRLRTRMGMKERVKSGLWMGGGRVPFGYDYDKNKGILVPNEDAEKVRNMYKMYIDGKSSLEISKIYGMKYDVLVNQILKRKTNYGVIEYNGEIYEGKHEPIISKETYDTAMQEMKRRSYTRTSTGKKLLTGLIWCGCCGAKMRYQQCVGKRRGERIDYGDRLICYSHQKDKEYLVKDKDCKQENLWAKDVEKEVLSVLFKLKEGEYDDTDSSVVIVDVLWELQSQYDDLVKKIKKLYNLYAIDESDILLDTINEEKGKLEDIQELIDIEKEKRSNSDNRKKTIEVVSTLEESWEYMTIEERKTAVRLLINKITITHDNINIDLNI